MAQIGAILAGGKSQRMGGADKGAAMFNGKRLVDHVFEKLSAQADIIVISGADDYGLGVSAVPDLSLSFGGPVNGVFSVLDWVRANYPAVEGFATVPVDGPFLPDTLFERLSGTSSAIGADKAGIHPTFAYWNCLSLEESKPKVEGLSSLSLKKLAALTSARCVHWLEGDNFVNINRPGDFVRWEGAR